MTHRPFTMHRCPTCGGAVAARPSGLPIEAIALRQLAIDLDGCHEDCWRFFEVVFSSNADRAKTVAAELGLLTSTLNSRFFRAGLPSARAYLAGAKLVRAAALFEDPRMTVGRAAAEMGESSPQSFSRFFRTALGLTASEFRRMNTAETMLAHFRTSLILPYREKLLAFHPTIAAARAA